MEESAQQAHFPRREVARYVSVLWFNRALTCARFDGKIITVRVGLPEVRSAFVKGANKDAESADSGTEPSKLNYVVILAGQNDSYSDDQSSVEEQLPFLQQQCSADDDDDDGYDTEDCEAEELLSSVRNKNDECGYESSEEETTEVGVHTFFIHESVLRSTAAFFDQALKKDWEEGKSGIINLPDIRGQDFEIYATWLYTGRVTGDDVHENLRECYELGNYLCDADFNDALIDSIIRNIEQNGSYCSTFLFRELYTVSRENSPHRRLAVDVFVDELRNAEITAKRMVDFDNFDTAFTRDVILAFSQALQDAWSRESVYKAGLWPSKDVCRYHEHANGEECYKEWRKRLFQG